jgi:GGDEF domain-containing protein
MIGSRLGDWTTKETDMLGREDAMGHPALTDRNTGIANLLHFDLVFRYLFHGTDRGASLTVMLISTPAVDPEALRALGEAIKRTTRGADLVAHLGEGRFGLVLLGSNLAGGRLAVDRVETALKEVATGPLNIGLATYHPQMKDPTELLQRAREALQRAEEAGGGLEMWP